MYPARMWWDYLLSTMIPFLVTGFVAAILPNNLGMMTLGLHGLEIAGGAIWITLWILRVRDHWQERDLPHVDDTQRAVQLGLALDDTTTGQPHTRQQLRDLEEESLRRLRQQYFGHD